ncbi:hypothetical protein GC174_06195 [bacterium]|nr:hypothetical protein [bacterium]
MKVNSVICAHQAAPAPMPRHSKTQPLEPDRNRFKIHKTNPDRTTGSDMAPHRMARHGQDDSVLSAFFRERNFAEANTIALFKSVFTGNY